MRSSPASAEPEVYASVVFRHGRASAARAVRMSGLEPTAGQWLMGVLPAVAILAVAAGMIHMVRWVVEARSRLRAPSPFLQHRHERLAVLTQVGQLPEPIRVDRRGGGLVRKNSGTFFRMSRCSSF